MKKVFVSGCYDLLHSGHVEFFRQASQYGDLYVGIGSDQTILGYKHHKTFYPEQERLFMVKSIKYVKDADNQGYPYIKRFTMDATKRHQNFMGENPNCKLILLTDTVYPRIKVTYGGVDAIRPAEEIDAEQFIAQKSFKAKGKRLTTWKIDSIEELEPTRFPEPSSEDNDEEPDGSDSENEGENLDPDAGKSEQQVIDELTGQTNLFSEKDFEEDQKDKDWLSKQ